MLSDDTKGSRACQVLFEVEISGRATLRLRAGKQTALERQSAQREALSG